MQQCVSGSPAGAMHKYGAKVLAFVGLKTAPMTARSMLSFNGMPNHLSRSISDLVVSLFHTSFDTRLMQPA